MNYKDQYKGQNLILLTTTRPNGSLHKCFYLYDTEACHNEYDANGKLPNVVRTYEPYDGVSHLITGNGD